MKQAGRGRKLKSGREREMEERAGGQEGRRREESAGEIRGRAREQRRALTKASVNL